MWSLFNKSSILCLYSEFATITEEQSKTTLCTYFLRLYLIVKHHLDLWYLSSTILPQILVPFVLYAINLSIRLLSFSFFSQHWLHSLFYVKFMKATFTIFLITCILKRPVSTELRSLFYRYYNFASASSASLMAALATGILGTGTSFEGDNQQIRQRSELPSVFLLFFFLI